MNERIKLLIEQSYDTVEYNYAPSKEFFNKQKFAELIVRDCALTAGLMEHEGRNGIGAQLLDNFGIAE
jgi:hypothetical protein